MKERRVVRSGVRGRRMERTFRLPADLTAFMYRMAEVEGVSVNAWLSNLLRMMKAMDAAVNSEEGQRLFGPLEDRVEGIVRRIVEQQAHRQQLLGVVKRKR